MDYKLISTYLDYCKTHKRLSSHTIRAYKNDLMQFYNSDYDNVESYIEQLTRSNIKTNTLRRKIACMKVFYNYLKYQNIIEENPFNQLRFQFRTEKVLPKTIPYDILKSIFIYLERKVIVSKTDYQKQHAEMGNYRTDGKYKRPDQRMGKTRLGRLFTSSNGKRGKRDLQSLFGQ